MLNLFLILKSLKIYLNDTSGNKVNFIENLSNLNLLFLEKNN